MNTVKKKYKKKKLILGIWDVTAIAMIGDSSFRNIFNDQNCSY